MSRINAMAAIGRHPAKSVPPRPVGPPVASAAPLQPQPQQNEAPAPRPTVGSPAALMRQIKDCTAVLESAMAAYSALQAMLTQANMPNATDGIRLPRLRWEVAWHGQSHQVVTDLAALPREAAMAMLGVLGNYHFDEMRAATQRIDAANRALDQVLARSEAAEPADPVYPNDDVTADDAAEPPVGNVNDQQSPPGGNLEQ